MMSGLAWMIKDPLISAIPLVQSLSLSSLHSKHETDCHNRVIMFLSIVLIIEITELYMNNDRVDISKNFLDETEQIKRMN